MRRDGLLDAGLLGQLLDHHKYHLPRERSPETAQEEVVPAAGLLVDLLPDRDVVLDPRHRRVGHRDEPLLAPLPHHAEVLVLQEDVLVL